MSKPLFIHEDSEFAHWWKILNTEGIVGVMNPIDKPHYRHLNRFFMPPYQHDVYEYGFPEKGAFLKMRDLGRKTVLSGMGYHDLMTRGVTAWRVYTALDNKINFQPIDINAYDASKHHMHEIDEIGQWQAPLWKSPTVKLEKYINKLLHTEKTFDADFAKFKEWLKQRLAFKRMDRYDLGRNNFFMASRRYGITFAGQSFTTY